MGYILSFIMIRIGSRQEKGMMFDKTIGWHKLSIGGNLIWEFC